MIIYRPGKEKRQIKKRKKVKKTKKKRHKFKNYSRKPSFPVTGTFTQSGTSAVSR